MTAVPSATPTSQVGTRRGALPASGRLKLSFDPLRVLLFALLVLSISKIHAKFAFLIPLRPALLLALLTLLYAVANPRALATDGLLKTWPSKVMAGLGFMACLSVPFGLSMGGSAMFILTDYSKILILGFLIVVAIRNTNDLLTMIWGYVIATGCLAWLAIFVFRVKMERTGIERIAGGFTYDSNDMCVIGVVGIAMALLLFQTSKMRGKVTTIVIMLMIAMMIARSGSRGGFLGLLAVGGAMFVMVRTVSMDKKIAVAGVLGLGLFLAAPQGYVAQMKTILTPTEDYNYNSQTGRMELWKRGMGYMITHPATGIGVDNFQRAEGTITDLAIQARTESYTGVRWNAAHNTLVQAGSEMGIPGFLLMAMLMYRGIYEMYRIRRRLPKTWIKGSPEERFLYQVSVFLPVALVAFGTSGLLVSHAYLESVYVLGGLQAGFYAIMARKLAELEMTGGVQAMAVQPVRRYRGGLPQAPASPPPSLEGRFNAR